MAYKSIFDTKPKKENAYKFAMRIVALLSSLYIYDGRIAGLDMLNKLFRKCSLNQGYATIDDLLKEENENYASFFRWNTRKTNVCCEENEVLSNIDIIANILGSTPSNAFMEEGKENLGLIFKAIEGYLLSIGLKLYYADGSDQLSIIPNDVTIDVDEIADDNVKEDILTYYDYRTTNNRQEKKKILTHLLNGFEDCVVHLNQTALAVFELNGEGAPGRKVSGDHKGASIFKDAGGPRALADGVVQDLWVYTAVFEHIGVHYARAEHFLPPGAFADGAACVLAFAEDAFYVHLNAGLRKREERGPKPHLRVFAEKALHKYG